MLNNLREMGSKNHSEPPNFQPGFELFSDRTREKKIAQNVQELKSSVINLLDEAQKVRISEKLP